jgi:hypothetical protein
MRSNSISCLQLRNNQKLPWSLLINESCKRTRWEKGLNIRLLHHFLLKSLDTSKKGIICVCPTDVHTGNLWQKAERGKFTGSESTTRFPRASCFEKPMGSVPETWGRMYDVPACRRPLAQPRNSTTREECAALYEQNLLLKEGKRGLHRTPRWIL